MLLCRSSSSTTSSEELLEEDLITGLSLLLLLYKGYRFWEHTSHSTKMPIELEEIVMSTKRIIVTRLLIEEIVHEWVWHSLGWT